MFEQVDANLGGLDVLINNAGIAGPTGGVEKIAADDWCRTVDINLNGHFYCANRAVLMLYKSQNVAVNNTDISLDTFPISGSGGVPTFTGTKKTMGFRGYTRDAQITITQTQPVFLTVLSLDFKVSIGQ